MDLFSYRPLKRIAFLPIRLPNIIYNFCLTKTNLNTHAPWAAGNRFAIYRLRMTVPTLLTTVSADLYANNRCLCSSSPYLSLFYIRVPQITEHLFQYETRIHFRLIFIINKHKFGKIVHALL